MITPEGCIQSIRRLLFGTFIIQQKRNSYNYRGIDITDKRILESQLNIRKAVSDWGQYVEQSEGRDLLSTILLKTFQLGQQYERERLSKENAHLEKIDRDIQNSKFINSYSR